MFARFFRGARGRVTVTQLHSLYFLMFFLALFSSVPSFANSSFLETFLSEQTVGIVFSVGSLLSLLTLVRLPRLLSRFGVFRVTLMMFAVELLVLAILSTSPFAWLTISALVLHLFIARALFYSLDIFVESFSSDEKTGTIRGVLLTVMNAAILFSPLILALTLGETENYERMYIVAGALLIPAVAILVASFKDFKDPVYERVRVRESIAESIRNKDLFNIFGAQFILRFFYTWMIIYTPLYLINEIGLTWAQIGPIFTIMLLPFPLLQLPIGKIADKYLGEKEILITGFIIMGLSTALLSFYTGTNIVIWGVMLFMTRIGASVIEVLSDSYFFKNINSTQTSLVALYRIVSPASYVVAPLVSTVALTLMDIRYTFVLLGAIVLTGVIFSANINDTK